MNTRKLLIETIGFSVPPEKIKNITYLDNKEKITEAISRNENASKFGLLTVNLPVTYLNTRNENNRTYSTMIMENAIRKAKPWFESRSSLSRSNEHPETEHVTPTDASHIVTAAWIEGNELWNTWEILNTYYGQQLKALIEAGISIPVSIRGVGSEDSMGNIQDDYEYLGCDCVATPSARIRSQPEIVQKLNQNGSPDVKFNSVRQESNSKMENNTNNQTYSNKEISVGRNQMNFSNLKEFKAFVEEIMDNLQESTSFDKYKAAIQIENALMQNSSLPKDEFGKCYKHWEEKKQEIFKENSVDISNEKKNPRMVADLVDKKSDLEKSLVKPLNLAKNQFDVAQQNVSKKEDTAEVVSGDNGDVQNYDKPSDAVSASKEGDTVIAKKSNGEEIVIKKEEKVALPESVTKLMNNLWRENQLIKKENAELKKQNCNEEDTEMNSEVMKEKDKKIARLENIVTFLKKEANSWILQQEKQPEQKEMTNNVTDGSENFEYSEKVMNHMKESRKNSIIEKKKLLHALSVAMKEAAIYRKIAVKLMENEISREEQEEGQDLNLDMDQMDDTVGFVGEDSVDCAPERADWMKTGAIKKENKKSKTSTESYLLESVHAWSSESMGEQKENSTSEEARSRNMTEANISGETSIPGFF